MENPIKAKITISYNYDSSSINFEDNFKQLKFNRTGLWQYIRYGETQFIDRLEDLFTIKNNNRQFLIKWLGWTIDEAEKYSKDDLRQEIIDQLDFNDLYNKNENYINGLIIENKFIAYETRGYSQGDYAKVIVLKDDNFTNIQKYIDQIFWDTPIWGRVEIFHDNGHDFTFELNEIDSIPEYLEYNQDIDFVNNEILNFISNEFKYVPAKENIIKAIKEAFLNEIKIPKY